MSLFSETSTAPDKSGLSCPRKVLSVELKELSDAIQDRPATLGEVVNVIQGRSYDLLLIVISLPFLTPIPVPLLSTPFGMVIALIGFRLFLGLKPWIPQRILQKELPPGFLHRLLKAAGWIVRKLELFLRPRLLFLSNNLFIWRLSGLMILVAGILLLLPLPVPGTNTFPGWTVLFLAAAAIERDGVFFLAGCFTFLLTLIYFGILAFGGVAAINGIWHSL